MSAINTIEGEIISHYYEQMTCANPHDYHGAEKLVEAHKKLNELYAVRAQERKKVASQKHWEIYLHQQEDALARALEYPWRSGSL